MCSELRFYIQSFSALKYLLSDPVCLVMWPLVCGVNKFLERDWKRHVPLRRLIHIKEGSKKTGRKKRKKKALTGNYATALKPKISGISTDRGGRCKTVPAALLQEVWSPEGGKEKLCSRPISAYGRPRGKIPGRAPT